jgi:hypothetical protein
MSGGLTSIRASALTNYPDCPRRAAAGLFRAEIEDAGFGLRRTPQGGGATVGTAVHAAAALMLTEKAAAGALPPLNIATDAGIDSLRRQLEEAGDGMAWDAPGRGGGTADPAAAETQIVRMVQVYREQIAPGVNPLLVEERLEAEFAPGVVLTGQADLVAREPGTVRDLKTGAKMQTHAPQVGAYSLLARSCRSVATTAAQIDFIPRVSPKKEQPPAQSVRVPLASAETAAVAVLSHIARDLTVFREGDPARRILPGDPWAFIANPKSVLCNPKYCAAFGTDFCREHAGADNED